MAHRVHRRAAVVRLAPHPALAAGLAQADVHVLGVADRADRRPALGADAADLAGRQGDLGPTRLAGRQGGARPGRTAELAAAAGLHLQVVDRHTERDAAQGQAVADARFRLVAADDPVARLEPLRG